MRKLLFGFSLQENKIKKYRQRLIDAGHTVTDDEEDSDED